MTNIIIIKITPKSTDKSLSFIYIPLPNSLSFPIGIRKLKFLQSLDKTLLELLHLNRLFHTMHELMVYLQSSSHRSFRSEEHTSELQSRGHLVCRLLLEKKKITRQYHIQ